MNFEKFNLKNKVAFITGGGGFLGLQHAEALLKSEAIVVLSDISNSNLEKSINLLQEKYSTRKIFKIQSDVTSMNSLKDAQEFLSSKNLFVDILINNAAIDPKVNNDLKMESSSRLEKFDISEWNKQIAVGLTGALNCIKVFGFEMAQSNKNGVILNIASDLSVIAPDQRIYRKENIDEDMQQVKPVTYSVIKSGLVGLTKYVATYWADKGVRCNALSPGGIFNNQSKMFVSKLENLIPMNRMAKIDEYQGAVQFLCSDASSYMTGQNIVIDGGRSVW
tara:strand:- start:720 stop:1553 length:834 start_codon:yes stop_codon:yes gene_type:complete